MIDSISITNSDNKIIDNLSRKVLSASNLKKMPVTDTYTPSENEQMPDDNSDEYKLINYVSPKKARTTGNIRLIGMSVAAATILTAGVLFFLLKGGGAGSMRTFSKLRNFLESKLQKSKLSELTDSKIQHMYAYLIKKIDFILEKKESINNFTTVKDSIFKKMMYATPVTKKIHDGITKMFEKIGRNSVVSSYKYTSNMVSKGKIATDNLMRKMSAKDLAEVITIDGVSMTREKWLCKIYSLNNELAEVYDQYFGSSARKVRYLKMKKSVDTLKAKFLKLSSFLSKDLINTFMAESTIIGDKKAIQLQTANYRKIYSYSVKNLINNADKLLLDITQYVPLKEIGTVKLLSSLRFQMKNISKLGSIDQTAQKTLIDNLDILQTEFTKYLTDAKLPAETSHKILSNIAELKSMFENYKQGKVEDILQIYKNILSPKEFKKMKDVYYSGVSALDKSIKNETEEFFSKIRDLTIGSAPTDILTIVGSVITLLYNLIKSDNNEQRTSISLKYGIPALAGIGVSLYCNAKLFAGTKSLMIAGLSTLVLNKLGVLADDELKRYRLKKKNQQPESAGSISSKNSIDK